MQFEDDQMDRMRNEPDNYIWGVFYFNPKDPRIMLPKRNRFMGWTVNFASPYSYLILIGMAAFAIFLEYLYSK